MAQNDTNTLTNDLTTPSPDSPIGFNGLSLPYPSQLRVFVAQRVLQSRTTAYGANLLNGRSFPYCYTVYPNSAYLSLKGLDNSAIGCL